MHMAYCSKISFTTLIWTMTSSFNARFLSCAFSKFGSLCYNYVQLTKHTRNLHVKILSLRLESQPLLL